MISDQLERGIREEEGREERGVWTSRLVTRLLFAFFLCYLIAGFISKRFLIHAWPLGLLFFAAFLKDLASSTFWNRKKTVVLYVLSLLLVAAFMPFILSYISSSIVTTKVVNSHFEEFGLYMRSRIPEKELIFHSNWSDSQYFIGLDPDHYYFVTLDPVYMYAQDPEKYALYRDVAFGRVEDPYTVLKRDFGARYGYAGKNYFGGLIEKIRRDGRFRILKEDGLGIIFRLKE